MTQEETTVQLEALFKKNLDPIREDIGFLKENMATKASLQELREFTESSVNDIMEIVVFLKDNAASKEDLHNVETGLRQEMKGLRQEMRTEFVDVRYKMADMQTSISVLDGKVDQIQVGLARLNKRDEEDTKALGNDVFSLKKRVGSLEGKRG